MKIILKIALVVCFFVVPNTQAQEFNFSVDAIPEELKKDANAVIRFEHESVDIKSQKTLIYKVSKAVTVLNSLGNSNKYVVVPYDKNSKVKNIKTIIYDSRGSELKKVKSKDYRDLSQFDGFSLYSDGRMVYYEYDPIGYPYTIHYEYEYESVNTGFIPSWRPISRYLTSIEESIYSISAPSSLDLQFKEFNFEDYNVIKSSKDGKAIFKISNQEIIKSEPYDPFLEDITPKLRSRLIYFSLEGVNGSAQSWSEFGKWRYEKLKNGNDEISEDVKNIARNLVKGITNPIEKAKIIYEYVQGRTRYISVQEGIGGWMPIKAQEVHEMAYGDCKGLTNYTKMLLDAINVESYYTVLWAGEEKKSFEKDFPSMQGNHVFLNLPTTNGDIWLECTSQKVPFGHLGDFSDDRDVLVITPEGGIIKHTKKYEAEDNLQLTKGDFEVSATGEITAKLTIESHGIQYDTHMHSYDGESQKELDIAFKDYFSNINNIEFSKIEVFNNKEASKYDESLEFKASNYATFSGAQMLIPVNAFNKITSSPKRVRNRKLGFEFLRGYLDIDEVTIKIPEGFKIEYTPENLEIDTKFGSYAIQFEKIDERTFNYKRTIEMKEGKFPKEEYENYRDFRKKIRRYDNTKIILNK